MNQFFKTLANFALVTLMTAVVLRPVVVEVSTSSGLVGGSASHFSFQSHHERLGLPLLSLHFSKSQKFSSLKVIPKETVNFDGVSPRFAEFRLSLPSQAQPSTASYVGGSPLLKTLVLRI